MEGPSGPSVPITPVMTIQEFAHTEQIVDEFIRTCLKEKVDYGISAGKERTLWKPGAEKFCSLFGLDVAVEIVDRVEDFAGERMGEPFAFYLVNCAVFKDGRMITNFLGSASSLEKDMRFRTTKPPCPNCGVEAIAPSNKGGFYCKECKMGFAQNDQRITSHKSEEVPNPDIYSVFPTVIAKAEKRAFIGAVRVACNLSGPFPQQSTTEGRGQDPANSARKPYQGKPPSARETPPARSERAQSSPPPSQSVPPQEPVPPPEEPRSMSTVDKAEYLLGLLVTEFGLPRERLVGMLGEPSEWTESRVDKVRAARKAAKAGAYIYDALRAEGFDRPEPTQGSVQATLVDTQPEESDPPLLPSVLSMLLRYQQYGVTRPDLEEIYGYPAGPCPAHKWNPNLISQASTALQRIEQGELPEKVFAGRWPVKA